MDMQFYCKSILTTLTIFLIIACVCTLSLQSQENTETARREPDIKRTEIFRSGVAGYFTYRIPSLVMTRKGTLLAAVAARLDSQSDWANIDIMLRRSTDQGKTWEPQHIVVDDGENTVDNATFIVDPNSDKVFLIYQINYDRAYLKFSEDEGQRWSSPQEITSAFDEFRDRDGYLWEVIAMGPGHGIVLQTGRYVVPVWLSTKHAHRPSISATIYSDDQGKTWHAGQVILETTEKTPNPSEHVLIELADGSVMSNLRTESQKYCRVSSISSDGATNWSKPVFRDDLIDPICMASMVRQAKKQNGAASDRILFCNPNSTTPRKSNRGSRVRQNVTVRLSEDEGKTWPTSRVLEPGLSGYSDIAVASDGTIFVLYESGGIKKGRHTIPASVIMAKFKLNWLQGRK